MAQSKYSGSVYGQRMLPQKVDIKRECHVVGSKKFVLEDEKIQDGAYYEAVKIWEEVIAKGKPRLVIRGCYNLAV